VKTAAYFHLPVQDVPKAGVSVIAYILKISNHPPTSPIAKPPNNGPHAISATYTPAQNADELVRVANYITLNGNDTLYVGGLLMEYFAALGGVH
jgi:hypothetical protein